MPDWLFECEMVLSNISLKGGTPIIRNTDNVTIVSCVFPQVQGHATKNGKMWPFPRKFCGTILIKRKTFDFNGTLSEGWALTIFFVELLL